MINIYNLLFYILFFFSLILISLVIIISSFFVSTKSCQKIGKLWIIFILKALEYLCGISWTVDGEDNIPKTPFVMVSNHQGPWESLFLQTLFLPTSSIIKKEILMIPFFGWGISRLGPITINRGLKVQSLRKVIDVGGHRIKKGFVVLIFPEGTRRKPEDGIGKFGNSCGVLASNQVVPIIPICHNSGKYWMNRTFKKKSGDIKLKLSKNFLKPINEMLTEED